MSLDELSKPENTLRKIIRAFFSDLHIVIIELILKENYITEYSLSTELGLSIDRIRLVTNNLIKEKLINYEERSFKNLEGKKDFFRITKKKGFKLRYLYFDKIFFTFNLKKKFKKIISKSFEDQTEINDSFLICPRKVCGKVYKLQDIKNLSVDKLKGKFLCTNTLTYNIICGSKLIGDNKNLEIRTDKFKIIKAFIDFIDFSGSLKQESFAQN